MSKGYTFRPHSYSNGYIHEMFYKDNTVLELSIHSSTSNYRTASYHDAYIIRLEEYTMNKASMRRYLDNNSHFNLPKPSSSRDIKYYYCIARFYDNGWFVDSLEEYRAIKDKKTTRRSNRPKRNDVVVYDSKYNKLVIEALKRKPKCKSIRLGDISRIGKDIISTKDGKSYAEFYIIAKNKRYELA